MYYFSHIICKDKKKRLCSLSQIYRKKKKQIYIVLKIIPWKYHNYEKYKNSERRSLNFMLL